MSENGMLELFRLGNMPVTAYGLALVIALTAGLAVLHDRCKKKGLKDTTALNFAMLALPLGLICARLMYVLCRLGFYGDIGYGEALKMWQGGYALWGAIGGCVLAAALCSRWMRQPLLKLMDAAAAPAALVIALGRMAEFFNGEGIGMLVEREAFQFFPLAVCNVWEEWYWAVFMLEAAAALAIFGVLLCVKGRDGHETRVFFFLFCTVSLLLESLRRDAFLRWLFVRVNQLTSVLVLTGMLVYALAQWLRSSKPRMLKAGSVVLCWAGFVLLAGICILLEFAVDKIYWLPVWACYVLMTLAVLGMGLCAGKLLFGNKGIGKDQGCFCGPTAKDQDD